MKAKPCLMRWTRRVPALIASLGLLTMPHARADETHTSYSFGVLSQRSASLTAQYWNPILEYTTRQCGIQLSLKVARTAPDSNDAQEKGDYDFVYFASTPRHPLHIRVEGERVDCAVRLCVSDNGAGIEAQYREQVFRAFERLQSGGTNSGIGLALVRRIVDSAGRRAWIDETPGGGYSVWFELAPKEGAP